MGSKAARYCVRLLKRKAMKEAQEKPMIRERGFTLIEVCIVTIISGLIFLAMFEVYAAYTRSLAFGTTYDNISSLKTAISTFKAKKGRYPCPADRTLASTHPNFGKETGVVSALKCDLTLPPWNLTPGNCYTTGVGLTPIGTNGVGGVCMIACSHPGAPPIGTDPVGTRACGDGTGATQNAVVIGAVPIASIRTVIGARNAPSKIMFDGWGNEFDYVATYQLTNRNTWKFDHGAISVHDESGNATADIDNDGHYGLVSHGPDQIGAYTRNGTMVSICGFRNPQSYTTGDDQNCAEDGTFISAISNYSKTAFHYDDIVNFVTLSTGGLWASIPNSPDIMNVNLGRVNAGTANDPLDSGGAVNTNVALNVGDPLGGSAGIVNAQKNAKAAQLCNKDGSHCFNLTALTNSACAQISCPSGQVMTGIYTDSVTGPCCATPPCTHAVCQQPKFTPPASIPDQQCSGGTPWMIGVASDGTIICGAVP